MMLRTHLEPRGFVLVAVLVVIFLVSMVAASLLFRMKASDTASAASIGAEQAWAAAMSGVQEAFRIAGRNTSSPLEWYDNPHVFRDRLVFDDGSDRWYFTVFSPGDSETLRDLRYGLVDEASKLNVNAAHTTDLIKLPRLEPAMIQALRDFVDGDNIPRPEGAEQEHYDTLPHRYAVRNGPLSTVDELLLVRGFTPSLLYGEDLNMNYRLDPNEDDGDTSFPPDNGDGRLDLGLRRYFTTSSYDLNEDSEGVARTNVNDPKDGFPSSELPAAITNFVALLRANNLKVDTIAELLEASYKIKPPGGAEQEIKSGIGKAELPALLDHFTTTRQHRIDGLINLNTASAEVLATVPEIDGPLAEAIVSARKSISPERKNTIAWLFQEDLVDAAKFKLIASHLTARSSQYSFHVAGFGLPSGRFRVLDVIIDLGSGKPVISYLRDITRLGIPFRLDEVAAKEATGG